ncbi:hypothetical protein OHQ89_27160 [Streptomyces canus]|uniref:hypothetical protein n=1 Tax=Streptomyces canus TaxID=58343 RepID=UPI0030E1DD34
MAHLRLNCRHRCGRAFQNIRAHTKRLAFGRFEVTVSGNCDGCGKPAITRHKTSRPDRVTYTY